MALETKLLQKLSQSLLMTPQLQQAIKMLQLGRTEFIEAIEKELLENPILEEQKDSGNNEDNPDPRNAADDGIEHLGFNAGEAEQETVLPSPGNTPVDWDVYLENYSDSRGNSSPHGFSDLDDKPSLESTVSKNISLYDHILSQIRLSEIEKSDYPIALHILGNLNRDGYLCSTYEEICDAVNCTEDSISRVMELIRSFDPPGIAARDLKECLLIQLDAKGLAESLEARIVSEHLDKLERHKYDQIAKAEKIALENVYKAVSNIQNLEPRPGRPFADETIRYIVPDIYVYKIDGEWVINLNEEGLPKLRISPYYTELLKKNDNSEAAPDKNYLNDRVKAASWLIRSMHQRQQTIYRVTESIVKFQKEFLEHGVQKLKPLVLKDVADDIGMHESTVSRVTNNKYVHTPQGVFELKYFFTTAIKTLEGDISSSSIKETIKNLINSEPADSPISDQQIVDILKQGNIEIARRTVAKYREGLGILSSSKRKKHF